MNKKIKTYVDHYFRFDKREDLEQLKEEIIGNLSERYEALIEEGMDEQKAYIEVVKTMGDFQTPSYNEVPETYKKLPSLPDYLLPISVILAVFATILLLMSAVVGGVMTSLSIICYATGGYYLYAKAMHVKSEEMDIELHKSYLQRIFKYMKTSFVFWSLNISYLIAVIIQAISQWILVIMNADTNPDFEYIQGVFQMFVVLSVVSFIIAFVVLLIVFRNLYQRLMRKYYVLTGESYIQSKLQDSIDFMVSDHNPLSKNFMVTLSYIFGCGLIFLFFITPIKIYIVESGIYIAELTGAKLIAYINLMQYYFIPGFLVLIGLLWIIATYIFYFIKKISHQFLYQSFIVMFVLFAIASSMTDQIGYSTMIGFSVLFVLIPCLLAMIYYISMLIGAILRRSRMKNNQQSLSE